MRLEITNPEGNNRAVRVFTRSTRTGQESYPTDLQPGDTAEVDASDEDHLVAIPAAPEPGQEEGAVREAPRIRKSGEAKEGDAATLRDATDEEALGVIQSVEPKGPDGRPNMREVNKAMKAAGFNGINAERRDALFTPAPPT